MAITEQKESFATSRAGGLGGSDIAGILGLSPWRTPIEVWEAKVHPENVPELDKECLRWGNLLEPVIRDEYAAKFGVQVVNPADIGLYYTNTRAWRDSTIITGREPFMLGTPDGLMPTVDSGLEIKCSSRRSDDWGTEGTDEIPAHYLCQVAWYMAVCEMPAWNIAVLFAGSNLQQFRVRRDMELEKEMVSAARTFWHDYVLTGFEPPVDQTESYGRYLARKFSLTTGEIIKNPSTEILNWTGELFAAEQSVKEAEERKQLCNNVLRELIGGAQGALTPQGKVAWVRPGPSQRTDWKAVVEAIQPAPEVIAQHTRESQTTAYLRAWWKKPSAAVTSFRGELAASK